MAVHETNCRIKYSLWPTTGTTVTNEGLAGAPYNGTADENHYHLLPSGAKSFRFDDAGDIVTIPSGSEINNTTAVTFEFLIRPDDFSNPQVLFAKGAGDYGTLYSLRIAAGAVFLGRQCYGGFIEWYTDYSLFTGDGTTWFDIQVSWTGSIVSEPLLKVNDVIQTLNEDTQGSNTEWADDSSPMYLGNTADLSFPFSGIIALFRMHNTNLSSSELHDNYAVDILKGSGIDRPALTGICAFFAKLSELARPHKTGRGRLVAQVSPMRVGEIPGLTGRTPTVTLTQKVTDGITLTGKDQQEENVE